MTFRILRLVLIVFVFHPPVTAQTPCKEVIGYYPGWQWYDRSKLVNPETIDYSQYTIINYAFLYPLEDGTLAITDPWSDKNLLLGQINWAVAPAGYETTYDLGNSAYHVPGTSLIHHAHSNDVDVMISIGGWTLSNQFPSIAADPTKRSNLAHWCNELIRVYGIDGIDIDWEYPGYAPHSGTPDDSYNYTLLLQEIRDSLNTINPTLKLTAAFGAAPDRMDDIEWDNIVAILDYINLMSYDFFGAFSPETNHNSPLYAPENGDTTFNIHSAVNRLINHYNVPSDMINMGIAFYGRSAKTMSTPGLHVATTGSTDAVTFSLDEGSPQYYNIVDKMGLFEQQWDATAQVPYLTGTGGLNTFVSYDDEASIGLKAQYVVDHELAGVIIWEITGDYMETSPGSGIILGTPLADTLNKVLCYTPSEDGTSSTPEYTISPKINVYPNPARDQIKIVLDQSVKSVEIKTISGRSLLTIKNTKTIDITNFEPGVYLATIRTNSDIIETIKFIKQD